VAKMEQTGKATGPSGIAGLPKQKKFCTEPVVYFNRGLFYYSEIKQVKNN